MCDPRSDRRAIKRPGAAAVGQIMTTFSIAARFNCSATAVFALAAIAILAASKTATAQSAASELIIRPPVVDGSGLRESRTKSKQPVSGRGRKLRSSSPIDDGAYSNRHDTSGLRQAQLQPPATGAKPAPARAPDLARNPCAAMDEKPLAALGIGIALPEGELPEDFAAACWNQLDATAGSFAVIRCWPTSVFHWNATCLCHRPLYFEQINLERHGYGCCEPLQPLASAAHFFGTVPALPYCMAVECPCECVYTLGHYRPGSCPPWRHHWPPCSPLAAAAEGGVWTGMVFLIP
jgi:hypothetical protein